LEQVGVAGLEPDAEPSAARIAEVQQIIRDNGTSTIFFESLGSSDIADTIASDLGVASASLSPLESQPEDGDYLTAMLDNLEALQAGLRCS
jgi:zinc transport system substrate-binding protein